MLTKPDLIGPGNEEEAAAVLKNVRKPLKLGYVMVKCRSQRDIDQGVLLEVPIRAYTTTRAAFVWSRTCSFYVLVLIPTHTLPCILDRERCCSAP